MYTTITNIAATKRDILYVQELFIDPLPLINLFIDFKLIAHCTSTCIYWVMHLVTFNGE